jgi:hypothetical protein
MSQLERLARPFPAKYVRQPAKGKYGEYVPHHVVTQAALAILGPFRLDIGEVFYGEDGKVEGCLVTVSAIVDGAAASITEVGDCEQPGNWKTQGARMKDAISDGVKRCFARLGLGLHLYSGDDYFLYDQLKSQGTVESTRPENAGAVSSPIVAAPATSKAKVQRLVAAATALRADGVDVDGLQAKWNLPDLDKCDDKQVRLWDDMLQDETMKLEAPFVEAPA